MIDAALTLDGVTKSYAGHLAVDDLSLEVPTGTVYGILGPNGAGKSTTLRMIMNIIARDSGRISLLGADPARDKRILRRIGYLPEERGLYKRMKVIDTIVFFAGLKGVDRATARQKGRTWLERMSLSDWADAKVETLSKGMQQKVQFIATILHEPDMLILDEPQAGLDPVNQEILADTIIQAKKQGRTVVLSTHYMNEAERMCDSVCIIARGRKILDGAVKQIRRSHRTNRYFVEFDAQTPEIDHFMQSDRTVASVEKKRDGFEFELTHGTRPGDFLAALTRLNAPLNRFEHTLPSLHDIFVRYVSDAAQPQRLEAAHV